MCKSENGSALVLVLVIASILLASSLWAVSTCRDGLRATEQLMDKFEARVGAESTLQILKYYGSTGRFSSGALVKPLPEELGFPAWFLLTGEEYEFTLHNTTIRVSLLDSSALLNCYELEPKVLDSLLGYLETEDEQRITVRESFMDWVDSDDYHHMNGAELYFYRLHGKPFGPRNNKALQSIWEISLLKGMDDGLWHKLRPFLTLVPENGFNLQTMNPSMLAAYFGLDEDQAVQLAALRSDGNLTISAITDITGRKYNNTFSSLSNFPSRIVRVNIEAEFGTSQEKWQGWLNFRSDKKGAYRILSWKEGGSD